MNLNNTDKVQVPDSVLIRELGSESVLLDMSTEAYFGLDSTGSRMWQALTTHENVGDALVALLDEYDVEADQLRTDLTSFVHKLAQLGLLRVQSS